MADVLADFVKENLSDYPKMSVEINTSIVQSFVTDEESDIHVDAETGTDNGKLLYFCIIFFLAVMFFIYRIKYEIITFFNEIYYVVECLVNCVQNANILPSPSKTRINCVLQ